MKYLILYRSSFEGGGPLCL